MSKVTVKLNSDGVRALLKSEGVESYLARLAGDAVAKLGDGYEQSAYQGKNRVNVSISAVSDEALAENLDSNTLLKAIGGA